MGGILLKYYHFYKDIHSPYHVYFLSGQPIECVILATHLHQSREKISLTNQHRLYSQDKVRHTPLLERDFQQLSLDNDTIKHSRGVDFNYCHFIIHHLGHLNKILQNLNAYLNEIGMPWMVCFKSLIRFKVHYF